MASHWYRFLERTRCLKISGASQSSSNEVARVLMAAGADPARRLLETSALDEARKAGDADGEQQGDADQKEAEEQRNEGVDEIADLEVQQFAALSVKVGALFCTTVGFMFEGIDWRP